MEGQSVGVLLSFHQIIVKYVVVVSSRGTVCYNQCAYMHGHEWGMQLCLVSLISLLIFRRDELWSSATTVLYAVAIASGAWADMQLVQQRWGSGERMQ